MLPWRTGEKLGFHPCTTVYDFPWRHTPSEQHPQSTWTAPPGDQQITQQPEGRCFQHCGQGGQLHSKDSQSQKPTQRAIFTVIVCYCILLITIWSCLSLVACLDGCEVIQEILVISSGKYLWWNCSCDSVNLNYSEVSALSAIHLSQNTYLSPCSLNHCVHTNLFWQEEPEGEAGAESRGCSALLGMQFVCSIPLRSGISLFFTSSHWTSLPLSTHWCLLGL